MPDKETAVQWTPFALSCLDEIYDYIAYKEKSDDPGF
jgi:plasmid stabilization system protein ParE